MERNRLKGRFQSSRRKASGIEAPELLKIASEAGINLDEISTGRAINQAKKVRSLGWRRLYKHPDGFFKKRGTKL